MLNFPIKPMLLETTEKPFDSSDYIYEWKVDGIRCILFYDDGKVRLQSKAGREFTHAFPELAHPQIKTNAIIDGELTVITEGKPDFEGTMERYHGAKNAMIFSQKKPAVYIAFDILGIDNKSVLELPLLERKALLAETVEDTTYTKKIDYLDTHGKALWEAVTNQGLEGIVAKKKSSRYNPGQRSKNWLKTKNFQTTTMELLGYKPKEGIILVSQTPGGRIQGHAMGIQGKDKDILWELLKGYGKEAGEAIMLPEGIKVDVKFTNWTPKGNMRDCTWVGFRV